MNKLLKWCFILVGTGLGLAAAAALSLTFWVDPNNYKLFLIEEFEKSSGYLLDIEGPLKWSFLPRLGLSLENARLRIPKSNAANPVVSVKKAQLQLDLIPLSRRLISINTLVLQEAQIHLKSNPNAAQKETNRIELGAHIQNTQPSTASSPIRGLRLRQVKVLNSNLYSYESDGSLAFSILDLNLETQEGTFQKEQPIRANFKLSSSKGEAHPVELQANWLFDPKANSFILSHLSAKLLVAKERLPFNLQGQFVIKPFIAKPSGEGDLKITFMSPHLALTDGTNSLHADAKLKFNSRELKLDQIHLAFGKAQLTGQLSIGLKPEVTSQFNLKAKALDLGLLHYLLKTSEKPSQDKTIFPIKSLRRLKLIGSLQGEQLQLGKLPIPKLAFSVKATNGLIKSPIKVQLANSHHDVNLDLDVRGATPFIHLSESTQDVAIKETLIGLFPEQPLDGQLDLNFDLSSEGNTFDGLQKNLKGPLNITINSGYLSGLDLKGLFHQSEQIVKQTLKVSREQKKTNVTALTRQANAGLQKLKGQAQSNNQTRFDRLIAQGEFHNGVLHHTNLELADDEFEVKGQGQITLPEQKLDYRFNVFKLTAASDPGSNKQKVHQTPLKFRIRGTVQSPSVSPDLESYFRDAVTTFATDTLKELGQEPFGKLLKGLGS